MVVAGALMPALSGCALDPAGAGTQPSRPAQESPASSAATPAESVAADLPQASSDEAVHQEQMRQLHHQGHSKHEFRAFHNMDEMHRMGGVPDMAPLDEYEVSRSKKMGADR